MTKIQTVFELFSVVTLAKQISIHTIPCEIQSTKNTYMVMNHLKKKEKKNFSGMKKYIYLENITIVTHNEISDWYLHVFRKRV